IYSALKGCIYPKHMAEGIKIQMQDKTYLVAVCHQEVNSPTDLVQIEACMGYGNVIVFEPDKDQLVGTVLSW
ncbi:MAG: heparinase, partial [Candidatus Cellulosilyticum pullistercoris]|nr:heparinase [Candidatus Cellulosilyticum pullistercoris]